MRKLKTSHDQRIININTLGDRKILRVSHQWFLNFWNSDCFKSGAKPRKPFDTKLKILRRSCQHTIICDNFTLQNRKSTDFMPLCGCYFKKMYIMVCMNKIMVCMNKMFLVV